MEGRKKVGHRDQVRQKPELTRYLLKGAQLVFVLGRRLQPPLTMVRATHRNRPYSTSQKTISPGERDDPRGPIN